jgi:cobyrinic acid a,c-diamide synthase
LAKALIVAAPNSNSGKTLVTLGLIRALRKQGLKVGSAKLGPDYIDARFHEAASGEPCLNLDFWAMGLELCKSLLTRIGKGKDIIIIEGVMGLFDGPLGAAGSTADFAVALGLPVVLVVDTSHQAQSVAALVEGFAQHRKALDFVGVILNCVRSDRHAQILQEKLAPKHRLGIVRHNDSLKLPSRHLGLIQAQEIQELDSFIERVASAVARETVLDTLMQNAKSTPNHESMASTPPLGQRLAIARDDAFSFTYPHHLQSWREAGAELSFFSPLMNQTPSRAANAVFLPGGYPELHAGKLAGNAAFLQSIRQSKVLVYGECGGYMVLGNVLIDGNGNPHKMAGLLPLTTSFAKQTLHLGYRELKPLGGPWKKPLRGHEFHYSTVISQGYGLPLFAAKDAAGNDKGKMGLRAGNVMGSYAHIISEAP